MYKAAAYLFVIAFAYPVAVATADLQGFALWFTAATGLFTATVIAILIWLRGELRSGHRRRDH